MITAYYAILIVSVLLFASLLTLGAYMLFARLAQFDTPDARSNHDRPVITGVGLGFMIAIIGFLTVVNAPPALLIGATGLLIVSLIDDRAGLPVLKRLGFQAIAVLLALHLFEGRVFQGLLPDWLDMAVSALLWLWMINLTNFMDGIDEITVTESGSITLSILLLGFFFEPVPHALMVDALVILTAVLSFFPWNRHPARCFMGDSGSVPLGYLLGYLLLALAAQGLWAMALILPAYHVADATVTLLRRALRREAFWQAHSQHFYQQAVRLGRRHDTVSRRILGLNAVLLGLAAVSLHRPDLAWPAIGAAYALALALCFSFAKPPRTATQAHAAASVS